MCTQWVLPLPPQPSPTLVLSHPRPLPHRDFETKTDVDQGSEDVTLARLLLLRLTRLIRQLSSVPRTVRPLCWTDGLRDPSKKAPVFEMSKVSTLFRVTPLSRGSSFVTCPRH